MFRDYQADIQVDLCFQSFAEELENLPGRYEMVLLAGGGCVALRPVTARVVELKRLFVYPEARGRGLGTELLRQAIAWARERGYERIKLDTIPGKMPSAIRLYEALGFREVPRNGGGSAVPGLVDMELALAEGSQR
jgi:GNAT superfamily N-acetyltransferase